MAKNIIICSDGTGNTAIKGRGTNVFKIFEAVDLNQHRYEPALDPQVAIYDDGVGTESFKPLKLLGGVFGVGLSRNVRQLYKELCRIYDPEDRIYLFGFSRGAFTVRTLAGLIDACGILKRDGIETNGELEKRVKLAYKNYRRRYRTKLMRLIAGEPEETREDVGVDIHFIGVWDTVDAVGLPFPAFASFVNATIYQFKFSNLALSSHVKNAFHALAIDDERHSFHPLLWDESKRAKDQVIKQVWFSGAHSNVGGGYPKQGMSLVALDWIMTQAEAANLRFIESEREYYRAHGNVDDKLYNPRAGGGSLYRWLPRDIDALCKGKCEPQLHLSVLERAAHGTEDYSPGNLPARPKIVFTQTGSAQYDEVASDRARKLEAAISTDRVLLHQVPNTVSLGRQTYVLFMTTLLVIAPLTLIFAGWAAASATLAASAAIAIPIAYLAKSSRQRHFSTYWLKKQQQLREVLKSTRDSNQPTLPRTLQRTPANQTQPEKQPG